ncbi:MAG: hypothetical protein VX589_02630 [Myxococcota bacterium]|nr:hypothetical protein [Myxococcota bacterium]
MTTGCGGSPTLTTTTEFQQLDEQQALPEIGHFYTQGLDAYAGRQRLSVNEIEKALHQALRRTLEPPAALDCLAREYAARFGHDGQDPPPSTVFEIAHHCGYWTKPANQFSVTGANIGEVIKVFRNLPEQVSQGMIGIGAVQHRDGKITATILVPPNVLAFRPISKKSEPMIRGRVVKGDGTLEVWHQSNQTQAVQQLPVEVTNTGSFEISLTGRLCPCRIEITRSQGDYRNTLALFRLDFPKPKLPYETFPTETASEITDRTLFALVNEYRTRQGLRSFVLEKHLISPLNHWLEELARHGKLSQPQGILDNRGWPYTLMNFGFSTGLSSKEAFHLLLETPTGFEVITHPTADRTAIGTLDYKNKRGADVVILALERFTPIATNAARQQILQLINQARQSNGHVDLTLSHRLSTAAQDAADAVRAGQLKWKQASQQLMRRVTEERLASGQFGVGGHSARRLMNLKFNGDPGIAEPSMKYVGVGIAQGPLPSGDSPQNIVIYVFSEGLASSKKTDH